MSLLEINVHGHELWGAIDEVLSVLEECKINGDGEINIIHGYKHGQVLKNYFLKSRVRVLYPYINKISIVKIKMIILLIILTKTSNENNCPKKFTQK